MLKIICKALVNIKAFLVFQNNFLLDFALNFNAKENISTKLIGFFVLFSVKTFHPIENILQNF